MCKAEGDFSRYFSDFLFFFHDPEVFALVLNFNTFFISSMKRGYNLPCLSLEIGALYYHHVYLELKDSSGATYNTIRWSF